MQVRFKTAVTFLSQNYPAGVHSLDESCRGMLTREATRNPRVFQVLDQAPPATPAPAPATPEPAPFAPTAAELAALQALEEAAESRVSAAITPSSEGETA
jgi:hypothetical protein